MMPDHVVRMMPPDWDWSGEPQNVAKCSCGEMFRVPRRGGGLVGALEREAKMEAMIAAHRAEVMRPNGGEHHDGKRDSARLCEQR